MTGSFKNRELPAGIGPHEKIEYDLLVSGQKDIAYFGDLIDPRCFQLADGAEFSALFFPAHTDGYTPISCIIYRNSHFEKAIELKDLILGCHGRGFIVTVEKRIGQLLGYSDEETDAWIQHWNERMQ